MARLVRFVALCLLVSVCAEFVVGQTCNPTDDSALQYFCREFVYARSEFKTWIPGTNCCGWQGVTCDSAGKVVNLTIQNIDQNPPAPGGPPYLTGTSLTGLDSLKSLYMKNVAFNGAIPPAWGTMSTLTDMSLESCNIDGPLPAELCNLKGLTTFDVYDNLLTGSLPTCYSTPFSTFPNMVTWNISQNNFS